MPVLLKPSAGGGGKGMRLVRGRGAARRRDRGGPARGARRPSATTPCWWSGGSTARATSRSRSWPTPTAAWSTSASASARSSAATRRSSRRRPSVLLDEATRAAMGEAAVQAARSCGYSGAGTVEFIVPGSDPASYFFMEMNTRLQVEHPVTELVTGARTWWSGSCGSPRASNSRSPRTTSRLTGHAVEARVYAEDPRARLPAVRRHGPGAARAAGRRRPHRLGPARGHRGRQPVRPDAVQGHRLRPRPGDRAAQAARGARRDTVTLGVPTNAGFLRRLLAHPAVVAGELDTGPGGARGGRRWSPDGVPPEVYAAAAAGPARRAARRPPRAAGPTRSSVPSGWRLGGEPGRRCAARRLRVAGHEPGDVRGRRAGRPGPAVAAAGRVTVDLDGVDPHLPPRRAAGSGRDGDSWHVTRPRPRRGRPVPAPAGAGGAGRADRAHAGHGHRRQGGSRGRSRRPGRACWSSRR